MNSATAVDPEFGCQENDDDKTNCSAFNSAVVIEKAANPSLVPLFSTTPEGPTDKGYRGYEFGGYPGIGAAGKRPRFSSGACDLAR